jgi:hypothetical protein
MFATCKYVTGPEGQRSSGPVLFVDRPELTRILIEIFEDAPEQYVADT